MDFQSLARRDGEQLDKAYRVLGQERLVGNREPAAVQAESVQLGGAAGKGRKREPEALAPFLLVELGEEQAGQIADRLGLQEIELHEPLDRRLPGPVGVAQCPGDGRLVVEAQPLLGPARGKVQVTAHRPEEALGALEPAIFRVGQQPRRDEFGGLADAMQIFADPVERVEVAQAALAVLDVGLDDIAAVAHLQVAGVALGQFGGDEFGAAAGDDLLAEAGCASVEQSLLAPDPARLQEGGADADVLARRGDQLVGCPGPHGRPSSFKSHSR